jgi:O-antigen/teichoic acid export membrane protein
MNNSQRTRPLEFVSRLLSDKSLTKKAYLNTIASMLEYMTHLLVGFVLTRFMVFGLGEYSFGLWQILNRLVGYLTPASGRPTYALKWTLANQQASDDYEQKRRYVGSAIVIWALFLPLLIGLGSVVTWYVPFWVKAQPEFVWPVRIVSMLLVVNMIVDGILSVPRSVLQGENLAYKRMGMSAIIVLLGGVATWVALYLKTGIVGVGVSMVFQTTISGLFFLWVVHDFAPWYGAAKPRRIEMSEMLGRSWWFLLWNLVTSLLLVSDVVVLGLFGSVSSVTNYTLTKYVPEMLITIIANIVFAITPGLGGIIGSGDIGRAVRLRSEIMTIIWLVVTAAGSTMLLWNRAFLNLWVGASHYTGPIAQLFIIVSVMQLIFIRSDANIIDLTLRLSQKTLLGLASVAISVVASAVAVGHLKMGVIGLCLGIMAGRLILSIGYPILIGRFMNTKFFAQLRGIIRPLFVTALFFGAIVAVDSYFPILTVTGLKGWVIFFLLAGITALVMLVLTFYVGLTGEQRKSILLRLRMVMRREDTITLGRTRRS